MHVDIFTHTIQGILKMNQQDFVSKIVGQLVTFMFEKKILPAFDLSKEAERRRFLELFTFNLPELLKTDTTIEKKRRTGFGKGKDIKKGESEIVTAIRSFPDDVMAHFQAITKQITEAVGTECEKYIAQLEILAPAILAPRVPILILGETGSGKNRLTNIIHDVSKGKDFPFIHVNCKTFTDELLLSELFGHEKGAFTGADKLKKGLVELANEGTLFLDEVDKAGAKTRNVLLKFLDDGTFYRVGGEEELSSDARIICGSNQDLPWMVENDLFEREFYERIAGFKPKIPPLRERKEDLESLVLSICSEISDDQSKILSKTLNKNVQIKFTIEPEALEILRMYPFPGNVRELYNIINNVYQKCFKHKTLIASKSIVLECLPTPKLNIKQKSLHYVEKELKDIFINWYQSFYFAKGKEIIETFETTNRGWFFAESS